jgi:integrase
MATIRKLRGRWQAQVRRRGVAPRAKSFNSKAEAQRWAQDLEAEANRSGWVADTRLAEKTTLRELLTRYCAEVTPGKRGAVSEASRINSILRCPMSHRTLAKLTSADVATYRDERLKSVAPATVVRELNTVSHAIEIATREWGLWLPRNPVKLVRRPQVPRGRTRRLKAGEEVRLLAACDSGRTPLMKPLIILAIETAMRRGEMLDLQWQHVDLVRCVAHLPLTKNGDSRDIPLSRCAVANPQGAEGRQGSRRRAGFSDVAERCSSLFRAPPRSGRNGRFSLPRSAPRRNQPAVRTGLEHRRGLRDLGPS